MLVLSAACCSPGRRPGYRAPMRDATVRRIALTVALGIAASCSAGEPTGSGDPAPTTSSAAPPPVEETQGRLVDIGNGREMWLECAGEGSPTVILVSGLRSSAQEWHTTKTTSSTPTQPVFEATAATTRVCAYDRPGTVTTDGPARSDPVPQPTDATTASRDLHDLLIAAGETGPFLVVGHSIGGTVVRQFAAAYPEDVGGMVLLDSSSEFLQDSETPEEWLIQRRLMRVDAAEIADSVAEYPDIELFDIDATFAALRAAPLLREIPLVVLSADELLAPQFPAMIDAGSLPAGTPAEFGATFDAAQQRAQAELARLTPAAIHITRTDSGHNIHLEQPQLVADAIRLAAELSRIEDRRSGP